MFVLIGYLASAFLAWSLVVTNTLRFRWLSTAGQISFIVYGVLINAVPIIVANGILLCINLYQMVKLYRYHEQFELVAITEENNIVQQFLKFYKKDIGDYFPNFSFTSSEHKICFVVLRDLSIANLFVANLTNDGDAVVEINYTVPNYRDYKVGSFIFDKEKEHLLEMGVQRIVYTKVHHKNHLEFITVMGFKLIQENGESLYIKSFIE
jgi:hypothetical protein